MTILIVFLIAISLALDAFSVSLSAGSYFGKTSRRQKFRLSFHFGLFQLIMPVIGWFIGIKVVNIISNYDHWIVLIILSILGIKMIKDGLDQSYDIITKDITKGYSLVSLSIATSLDALAVGFSLSMTEGNIFFSAIIIGIVASIMTLLGIKLGEKLSQKIGKKAMIIGGVILIIIGLNILFNHLGFISF